MNYITLDLYCSSKISISVVTWKQSFIFKMFAVMIAFAILMLSCFGVFRNPQPTGLTDYDTSLNDVVYDTGGSHLAQINNSSSLDVSELKRTLRNSFAMPDIIVKRLTEVDHLEPKKGHRINHTTTSTTMNGITTMPQVSIFVSHSYCWYIIQKSSYASFQIIITSPFFTYW